MAVISNSTFDTLSRRVNVRLQQGVPIVDADWNEMDDIRKFEMQAFLKWFVGDGVPHGNDGFRIGARPGPTVLNDGDFNILASITGTPDGLTNVGRILINGSDVIISADTNFRAQPLHPSQGAAADQEATRLGVPKIAPLTTPVANGTVVVYLDVWERLITPDEDVSLVLPGLGTESCARMRREWVVRTRPGTSPPAPGDADYLTGHSYYPLATITRRTGDDNISAGDLSDLREQRLLLPPATLITDLFGIQPVDYRRGLGRPAISFREAINALLRGELPGTPDTAIDSAPGMDIISRGFLFDKLSGLVAVWTSDRAGGQDQVFVNRLDLNNISGGFSAAPEQVTTIPSAHSEPHAVLLPNGELVVVYQKAMGAVADIVYKRAPLGSLAAAAEQPVADTVGVAERNPYAQVSGDLIVFFYHLGNPTNTWRYRRFRHTTNSWLDAASLPLSATTTTQRNFHATQDAAGNIWAAFQSGANIKALRLNPTANTIQFESSFSSGPVAEHPFVLTSPGGQAWVFWNSDSGLHYAVFNGVVWGAVQSVPDSQAEDRESAAVLDADGGIWLFWSRGTMGLGDIFYKVRNPNTGAWGQARQMTIAPQDDSAPYPLIAPNNAIYIFWASDRDGNVNVYFKRLITAL